jgi:hypothetical protein
MSLQVEGALAGSFTSTPADGCGASGPLLSWAALQGSPQVGVAIGFMGLVPPVDQLGTFPLAFVDLTEFATDAAPALHWRATAPACSVTITGSVCAPTVVFTQRRVLSGTVTCTAPAVADAGTTAAPVTIQGLSFVGFIDPQ